MYITMLSLTLTRDGKELLTKLLGPDFTTIGRSHDSTLQLIDPSISRKHCRIEYRGADTIITDLSRNGTLLNGESFTSAELTVGDIISIGPWTAKVCEAQEHYDITVIDKNNPTRILSYDAESKQIIEDKLFITVASEDQKTFKKRFSKSDITFGSHATSDVSIADNYVSRNHCKLVMKDDGIILYDTGSTNGTLFDGVRIEKASLPPKGTFTIGKTTVAYSREQVRETIEPSDKPSLGSMLGKSRAMREVFSLIKRAGPTEVTVCIQGESGTGKELAAREIHNQSARKSKSFVTLNCGAIPSSIIESMLFGHEKGAFTGAVERQVGVFEQANGGTLFLDEIGEMELKLQTRLLRVLEEKTVRRLGSKDDNYVDVRLIVATNRDLKQLVKEGAFREDLFYRLLVLPINLPSLRERKEDIPLLAEFFAEKHSPIGKPLRITKEAMDKLKRQSWNGNVRELKNTLMRAMIMAKGDTIKEKDIQFVTIPRNHEDDDKLNSQERNAILDALRKTKGNQTKASRILGIARTTISYKIGRYGIDLEDL